MKRSSNLLILTASLIAKDAIRYTPAGLPVIHCQLHHDGELSEAKQIRQVRMNVEAVAVGDVHRELLTMDLGAVAVFEGFLTQKTLRNERLVFHITKITLNE
ncbi:primosomal replication protein N [Polynucleobacter sp. HIN5]|uniref:primosomal replication protein N n=1 Tax=Polynucleobacter sp. HIN5 TaxID=3047864 RepID=UPI002573FEF8|nr:primosomal replication protein N [Polynucleobacter sp. HIN5]BEI33154.1 primosomal replication protein N [Polynucleobacter sp. HIN5]